MIRLGLALVLIGLALGGCQSVPVDTFCRTHSADDFRPTADELAHMSPAKQRVALENLRYGAKACGWAP
jgi:hypothetical protein